MFTVKHQSNATSRPLYQLKAHTYLKEWRHITEADTRIATLTIQRAVCQTEAAQVAHAALTLVASFSRLFEYSC